MELDPAAVPGGSGTTGSLYEASSYDGADSVTSSSDFNTYVHQYSLDGDNRATQTVAHLTGGTSLSTTTTSFDPDGNALSRSTQTQNPSGPVQTATDTQAVNAADWPLTTTDILTSGQQLRTAYGYDGAGQQRTQTILGEVTPITNTLNAEGLVTATSESLGGTPYTSSFAYNRDDLPITTTLPGGVQETAQYDKDSRLTHLSATGPTHKIANPLSSSYDYAYDPSSGWTSAVTATLNTVNSGKPLTQTLSHDALGRLTSVQSSSGTQSWTYDGNGNLLTSGSSGVTTTYGYNPSLTPNEVLTLTTPGQPSASYGYDQNGDVTGITTTSTLSTGLSYDSQARLVGVTLQDGTRVSLSYNAQGQRASYVVSKPGQRIDVVLLVVRRVDAEDDGRI